MSPWKKDIILYLGKVSVDRVGLLRIPNVKDIPFLGPKTAVVFMFIHRLPVSFCHEFSFHLQFFEVLDAYMCRKSTDFPVHNPQKKYIYCIYSIKMKLFRERKTHKLRFANFLFNLRSPQKKL